MTERRLVTALAIVGLAAGVVALASGSRFAALAAGAASVGVASVAIRSSPASRPSGGIDPDEVDQLPADWVDRDAPPRRRADDTAALVGPYNLLGSQFLEATLAGRIAVARRALRPLAVVHFEVFDVESDHAMPVPAGQVAATLNKTLRESDVAGWRPDGVFVFILEETGEDGAVWTAERLRRRFVTEKGSRRFRAGIAAYPTHGLDAEAVEAKAAEALRVARDWNRDRIEVASGI